MSKISNKNKYIILIAFFSFSIYCCNLFTFESLEITSSVGENQNYFAGERIFLHFSIMPNKDDIERRLRLLEGGSSVLVDFDWNGSTAGIRPRLPWQKGQLYSLDLQGVVRMEDGRTYTASLYRRFIYGEQGNIFELLSNTFEDNILTLQFSRPVLITSFHERFSLSPFAEHHTDFYGDGSTVIISPRNNWGVNATYLWTIRNMISADGYLMRTDYSGMFSGAIDTELPRFLFASPVDYSIYGSFWHTTYSLDNQLLDNQAIGFSFSKPMDEASVISGISFFPSISGYFVRETESRFIFVPTSPYQLRTEYRITISDNIRDTSGLALFEPEFIFFTTANQFLQVTEITFDGNTNPMPTDGTIYEYTFIPPLPNFPAQLRTIINFSTAIPQNMQQHTVNMISLNVLFPATANNPVMISAFWTDGGSRLSIDWSGFSISSGDIKNYYILRITGGQNGVRNQANEYLEEDVCVIFIAL